MYCASFEQLLLVNRRCLLSLCRMSHFDMDQQLLNAVKEKCETTSINAYCRTMSEDEVVFWERAGNPKFEAWMKAAESVVGEGNMQQVLHSNLAGGLDINPIYTDELTEALSDQVTEGVGLRSSNPAGNIRGWDIRQRHWITDAGSTNLLILEDLSRGAKSIELAIEKTEMIPYEEILAEKDREELSGRPFVAESVRLDDL